jgi:hypothetical protein
MAECKPVDDGWLLYYGNNACDFRNPFWEGLEDPLDPGPRLYVFGFSLRKTGGKQPVYIHITHTDMNYAFQDVFMWILFFKAKSWVFFLLPLLGDSMGRSILYNPCKPEIKAVNFKLLTFSEQITHQHCLCKLQLHWKGRRDWFWPWPPSVFMSQDNWFPLGKSLNFLIISFM